MGVKPGYKQTEVGVIPEDWDIKLLGSITRLLTNGFVGKATDKYVESDDGIIYIQGYNVEKNGLNLNGIKRISVDFHKKNARSILKSGDLLTIQTGDIGITTIVPPELEGANCHALIISRIDENYGIPEFFCQYFNSNYGINYFKGIETGTTMKHLNTGDVRFMALPVPPLPEQTAIATALSDVDALISALDRLIEKKRAIKQAAMQELLTGKRRLPGFSGEWDIKNLGDLGECIIGLTYKPEKIRDYGVLVLRSSNIHKGLLIFENNVYVETEIPDKLFLKKGDIVICVRNGSRDLIGKCVLIDQNFEGMTFGAFMSVFRTQHANFIFHQFQSDLIKKQIQEHLGATINQITNKSLRSFKIHFPPDNQERVAIATILSNMDAEIAALEARKAKTISLKQGMMQELLTGRIRLV